MKIKQKIRNSHVCGPKKDLVVLINSTQLKLVQQTPFSVSHDPMLVSLPMVYWGSTQNHGNEKKKKKEFSTFKRHECPLKFQKGSHLIKSVSI